MPTPRFQVVPAAYVYLRRGDDVLLQLRRNTGYMDGHWAAAAAGHVEAGESATDAAIREAAEELGLAIDPLRLVPLTAMHRTDGTDEPIEQRVDFMFTVESWEGDPVALETDKNEGLAWFPLADLPLMPPHERWALDQWREGTLPTISSFGFEPGQAVAGLYAGDPHVEGPEGWAQ